MKVLTFKMDAMKNLKKILLGYCSVFALTILTVGCNNNDDDNNNPVNGTSRVKIAMTDAPGDYDAVNIEVVDVKVKASNDPNEDNWISLGAIEPGVYNLLDLTGGVTVALADHPIPSGYLGQIRLILGDNNTVVKDGVTYPLHTPSAQQSGLKVQVNQTLLPNVTYNFLIDFDVDQSVVVQAGNSGMYNLHPVLRVTSEAVSGSIRGTVPLLVPATASVIVDGVTVSAHSDAEGVFYIHGLPAGTYAVTLTPDIVLGIPAITVENVIVTNAQTTDMGSISFG